MNYQILSLHQVVTVSLPSGTVQGYIAGKRFVDKDVVVYDVRAFNPCVPNAHISDVPEGMITAVGDILPFVLNDMVEIDALTYEGSKIRSGKVYRIHQTLEDDPPRRYRYMYDVLLDDVFVNSSMRELCINVHPDTMRLITGPSVVTRIQNGLRSQMKPNDLVYVGSGIYQGILARYEFQIQCEDGLTSTSMIQPLPMGKRIKVENEAIVKIPTDYLQLFYDIMKESETPADEKATLKEFYRGIKKAMNLTYGSCSISGSTRDVMDGGSV